MDIVVVGAGHTGLVTAACFAEMGNKVVCIDQDEKAITRLQQGELATQEPGLENLVRQNSMAGRLSFSSDWQTLAECQICIIAIGRPADVVGVTESAEIMGLLADIVRYCEGHTVIAIKSTVMVGTADKVHAYLDANRRAGCSYEVVSNPEFIKEGAAVDDFMSPDRIIIGTECEESGRLLAQVYTSFTRTRDRMMFMGRRDAEFTKYAATAMLATRISLMNELALMAESMDVDIENIRRGIGSDSRIGYSFIYPGCGYGGARFSQDVRTLVASAETCGLDPQVLRAVEQRNKQQKNRLFEKLEMLFDNQLQGKVIAVWGLAYKPGVADMSESSSIPLIQALLQAGARVQVYDPVCDQAMASQWFDNQMVESGQLRFASHQYDAVEAANALVLVTEWKPFRQPDFIAIKKLLQTPVIVDGRNQYDPEALAQQGFIYSGIGRSAG
ncbi:UDP-glucose dehydrogenase family protein [Oceanobacter mangrovi]|uniref:UDP-glucose dehydrogenase family protein n=1 Tax=Oceanobacter mangrovi TaxID=2862510 RepID=UPI001C8DB474|nr:UDP-glucose/GDP-mannose dehydrogenase family protein [Oceanobacter mangrovi]